jgi:hypothetical protein
MPRWFLTAPMTQQGQANRLRWWWWRVVVIRPNILFCPSCGADRGVVGLPLGSPLFASLACAFVGEVDKELTVSGA